MKNGRIYIKREDIKRLRVYMKDLDDMINESREKLRQEALTRIPTRWMAVKMWLTRMFKVEGLEGEDNGAIQDS